MHPPGPGMREDERTRGTAIAKGIQVLELVAAEGRPLGLTDMTERLGLPKPTVHRVVRQLEEEGLLQREALRDRYGVGPRLRGLALSALTAASGNGPVHEILAELVGRLGETCNVGMLDGTEVVYLDRVECDWPLRLQLAPNSRLPVHCTANGKLLLAFLDAPMRDRLLARLRLERYTANTITEPPRLDRECARIRAQDYAENDQEFHLGLIGLAVPVRDSRGRVVAGLAVHSPLPRLDLYGLRAHLPALREAAQRMGAALSP